MLPMISGPPSWPRNTPVENVHATCSLPTLAAAGPAANAATAPTQVAKSTLRIVDPPRLRVLGFREDGPFFTFLVPIPIPFGNGKLAQERTGACSKANRHKLFSDHAARAGHACPQW